MKLKKSLFLPLIVSPILPWVVVSCGQGLDPNEVFAKINRWLLTEKITPKIEFDDPQMNQNKTFNIKQIDFKNPQKEEMNYKVKWQIKAGLEQAELDDIRFIMNEIETKFSHFYLPRLNQDGKSQVFFSLKLLNSSSRRGSTQDFNFSFADLARFNGWTVVNLSPTELAELIKSKLNNTLSLVNNLGNIIQNYYQKNPDLIKIDPTTKQQTIQLNQAVFDSLESEIAKNKYFTIENASSQNLFILNDVNQKLTSVTNQPESFQLDLQISTSPKQNPIQNGNDSNPDAINFTLPFVLRLLEQPK